MSFVLFNWKKNFTHKLKWILKVETTLSIDDIMLEQIAKTIEIICISQTMVFKNPL